MPLVNGLAAELLTQIEQLPVIDCHEHLRTEKERVRDEVDVLTLFTHYCKADLEAAGLPQGKEQQEITDPGKPLMPRWKKFKPFYQAIRFGSYAYPAHAYVKDVLGFDRIDDDTVEAISQQLKQDNQLNFRLLIFAF